MRIYTLFILLVLGLLSCTNEPETSKAEVNNTMFSERSSEQSGLVFTNEIQHSEDFNIFNYRNFYNGGGVAIGDVNDDGLEDVYLTANQDSNRLFINKGDLKFEDVTAGTNIDQVNRWSTGATMIDINADGLLDIYVCNAGYQRGTDQRNALYVNKGNLIFEESAADYGLDDNGFTTHASFFDYDLDGDLDVYLLNNSFIPANTLNYNNKRELRAEDWPVADFLKGGGDKLLRNDDDKFIDVSADAGIYGSLIGFGLGVTVGDINNDGYPDIYVSNDFFERDYLYINQGDGRFSEELEQRIPNISHSSMGADMADINNDGALEIFVTDMLPDDDYRLKTTTTFDNINLRLLKKEKGFYNQFMHNTLQLNDQNGQFQEISFYSDVAASDWSWGALFFDADNDGLNDIYVCNGIYRDVIDQDFINFFANDLIQKMVLTGNKQEVDSVILKMPSNPVKNKFFHNQGNLQFVDTIDKFGAHEPTFSNGAAYADLDNDGDLDLIINNVNQAAQLYENRATSSFLGFDLRYKDQNPFGIGTKVQLYAGEQVLTREQMPSRGFQSSVSYRLHFGLGSLPEIDSIKVIWPNQQTSKLLQYKLDSYNSISYNELSVQPDKEQRAAESAPIFNPIKSSFAPHVEDEYNDFYYERNIPEELSKEGPCSAIADINGDGIEDIFIGAAAGQSAQLYISSPKGWSSVQRDYWDRFKAFEDTAAEFFDADGDGDLDLVVGSGGNNASYADRAFRDRLYINNDGSYEIDYNAIPPMTLNTSVIAPHDFDGDGDLDLFVGSRSAPGSYGVSPGSFIYMNNGRGQFLDFTQQLIPELGLAGMITDAKWVDILSGYDGKELILAGEWMSPKILAFTGQKFEIVLSDLDDYAGWWQTVDPADLDGDGDQDIVLGNLGLNAYLKADTSDILLLWINDFDDNGTLEKLITKRINGRDMPVTMKGDLVEQIPSLKSQNLMHSEYARKSIQDIFDTEKIKSATIKKINHLASVVAINNGDGTFDVRDLPAQAQLSCINDVLIKDVTDDEHPDLIIAGNNTHMLPQFSMLNSCRGKVLANDGKANFTTIPRSETGLDIPGVTRAIKSLKADKELILVLRNDDEALLYERSE